MGCPSPRTREVSARMARALSGDRIAAPFAPVPSPMCAAAKVTSALADIIAVAPAGAKLIGRNTNDVRTGTPVSGSVKWPTLARCRSASSGSTAACSMPSGAKIRFFTRSYQLRPRSRWHR